MTRPVPDLATLASRVCARPRTRFAPSPTGFLHLGHVVNAIYTWGLARALGGTVLLRIEDHDRERSRAEYERALLEELAWLGLEPDSDGPSGSAIVRQSDREALYTGALETLDAMGLVYACDCSRRQIDRIAGSTGAERRYPGTCRERQLARGNGSGLRLRMAPGTERFEDGLMGPQEQDPSRQAGDVLIRDRVGQWTYQFAAAVDDTAQQIDLVVRGADLLASTGRQIRIARLLGRTTPPVFVHHPLLYSDAGVKLSKSNRDTGLRELRARGLTAPDVLGLAAAAAGLIERARAVHATEMGSLLAPPVQETP